MSIIDDLTKDDLIQEINVVSDTYPKRDDTYPEDYDEPKFATRIMQFPHRFRNLWVLKPVEEIGDYSG